jgi:hypothetical protein
MFGKNIGGGTRRELTASPCLEPILCLLRPGLVDLGIGLAVGKDQELVDEIGLLLRGKLADLLGQPFDALVLG